MFTVSFIFVCPACFADVALTPKSTVHFSTVAEGRRILATADEFVTRLSPFDRAARLQTDKVVSQKQYIDFVKQHVIPWTKEEIENIESVLESLGEKLARLEVDLPPKIDFIKTTGREEGGAAYTRQNAIILPAAKSRMQTQRLERLLAHETFHILSRHDNALRERLYAAIGFEKCSEIEFPKEFAKQKITNPDAPKNDHAIQVCVDDRQIKVVPVLFSNTPYDLQKGGRFFDYLQFRLLAIERQTEASAPQPRREAGKPLMFAPSEVVGFFEQVGRNTNYLIHPEEILADNFADLVTGRTNWRSPDIRTKIVDVLNKLK